MINGDAFKLAFGERKFLIFHPYPEILAINHFYTMTLHKKELSALENHHTSSIPQCDWAQMTAFKGVPRLSLNHTFQCGLHEAGDSNNYCFLTMTVTMTMKCVIFTNCL